MRFNRREFVQLLFATTAAPMVVGRANAQTSYPSRPVTVILPFTAGGPMDLTGRIIFDKVSEWESRRFLLESKPGASGMIGTEAVIRAAPDGHTILFMPATTLVTLMVTAKDRLPFDSMTDLMPVMTLSRRPYVLMVNPDLGFKTAQNFVDAAKADPEKFTYSSTGLGGPDYFTTETFKRLVGIELQHIPYSGGAAAITAVANGEVSAFFGGLTQYQQFGPTGQVTGLGVTSKEPLAQFPELPTLEDVAPEFESWVSLDFFVPQGTSPEIVAKLRDLIGKAIQEPGVKERVEEQGELVADTPEEITARMVADYQTLSDIVAELGLIFE